MIPEGFHIHHYKEVSSTNKEALDLIDKGISNETVIIADKQIKGRGRTGKSWISPEGNFYASLIIDLLHNHSGVIPMLDSSVTRWNDKENLSKLTELTFVTALAVGNTILSFINGLNLQYKWPNDVLIDGKKISGILLEKRSNSNWLIIGIGINVNHAPLPGTTCISNYGESVSNIDLLKKLIINFNQLRKQWLFDGFHAIREMWLTRAFKLNKQISVKLADKLYEGIFADIDKSGKLVLQQKDGSLIYFDAGELFIDNAL
ncbi:biotin--[acetyl-CoA-carboxylase] ligase [Wolbachia endosymbiont of Cylisticus convexus]|uniref:biotin--[acetyl-CoA-carboxylase] ligase n=1 Tax=Wolbachia endosymbiont of Cylisticus convexus TaxID=118728 RepID=UPI000DF6F68C|nr:biotin--[acetyl-CoA-carboxylase] ligase [Wolbachia endosymbiont of Cylisticus convexus]RDD33638.1 biotin--[acetyl-CoA-carboxylase] ligase [Wolbachia endosymbiont of Cylisticus convexus]RDD35298.1 biotin--[acetyl-CoA-carboxylase] ligase [Wolbachia endosymbiont of Cylisticus convexus]